MAAEERLRWRVNVAGRQREDVVAILEGRGEDARRAGLATRGCSPKGPRRVPLPPGQGVRLGSTRVDPCPSPPPRGSN